MYMYHLFFLRFHFSEGLLEVGLVLSLRRTSRGGEESVNCETPRWERERERERERAHLDHAGRRPHWEKLE